MVTSDFGPEVEIWPFGACAMKYMHYIQITCEVPRISSVVIGTVRSLWTWLWGRYHVPQNVFLVKKESKKILGCRDTVTPTGSPHYLTFT